MGISFTIFVISGAVMAGTVFGRYLHDEWHHVVPTHVLRPAKRRADFAFGSLEGRVKGTFAWVNEHNAQAIYHTFLNKLYSFLLASLEVLRHNVSVVLHRIRRKREILRSRGASSFFLKSVKEYKEELRKNPKSIDN